MIQVLNIYKFSHLVADVNKVKMKSLKSLSTSTFAKSAINEFDAPNLNVTVETEKNSSKNHTFQVASKNFKDSPGII